MPYQFRDAYGSVLTAESSIVSGGANRPAIAIASFLTVVPITITGSPSISGAVSLAGGTASVSGVGTFDVNHVGNGSILAVIPGSVATVGRPASVSGVGTFNINPIGNGSVLVVVPGSVATAPSPASVSGVGLFNINPIGSGSVITVLQNASIAGTYAEDTAHTAGDRGLFVLGVRNDAVASFVSANSEYSPIASDSAGRILSKPFAPDESRVAGVASTVSIISTSVIAAAGAGLRNYITDILITNSGSVATRVDFLDGANAIIGRTIAPANGGSNIHLATPLRTDANGQFHIQADTAVSILGITALGYKAP